MQPNLAARHDLFSRHQTRMNRAGRYHVGLLTGTVSTTCGRTAVQEPFVAR